MQNQKQNEAVENGFKALQQQRVKEAYEVFKSAYETGPEDERISMGLAVAARSVGDHDVSLSAIEKFLASNKTHLNALILRGDALKARGEPRRAVASYMAALQAVTPNAKLDQKTISELQRAQRECSNAAGLYESYLRDFVSDELGSQVCAAGTRSALALDMVFGRAQIYHQQPHRFYFPELPQRQFYDRREFDWAPAVEAAAEDMKSEFALLADKEERFGAYVTADGREPHLAQHALTGSRDWSAIHLIRNGERFEDNLAMCPLTMSALENAPIPRVKANSPSVLFSRLLPGTHIPPHHGMMNTRLICHLPLVLPENCTIRVGNQTRDWTDGELLIFDDTIEHEAHNGSSQSRSVLIFDIWRPELTEEDRALVTTMFDGIAAFGA